MRASTGQLPALEQTVHALVARGEGILAADERSGTMDKRLVAVGIGPSAQGRRQFRELVFTAPEATEHISGAIMYDETIRQSSGEGIPFPQLLAEYRELGACFAKCRGVFSLGHGLPSQYAVARNAHTVGRYAELELGVGPA